MNFIRRIRGVAITAASWAVGWAGVASPISFLLLPHLGLGSRVVASLHMASYAAAAGAIVGAATATLIALFERRTTFSRLHAGRIGLWGAASGLAYTSALILSSPAARAQGLTAAVASGAVGVILGGASALLTLLVARKADRRAHLDTGAHTGDGLNDRSSDAPALLTGNEVVSPQQPSRARVGKWRFRSLAPAT